jgi:hypothetical protein
LGLLPVLYRTDVLVSLVLFVFIAWDCVFLLLLVSYFSYFAIKPGDQHVHPKLSPLTLIEDSIRILLLLCVVK